MVKVKTRGGNKAAKRCQHAHILQLLTLLFVSMKTSKLWNIVTGKSDEYMEKH